MFGLGTWEIGVILILALLVLGPDKLPKVARTIGKGMREMRRAANDLRMNIELDDVEPRPRPADADPAAPEPSLATEKTAEVGQITSSRIDAYDLSPNRTPIEAATEHASSGSGDPPASAATTSSAANPPAGIKDDDKAPS